MNKLNRLYLKIKEYMFNNAQDAKYEHRPAIIKIEYVNFKRNYLNQTKTVKKTGYKNMILRNNDMN